MKTKRLITVLCAAVTAIVSALIPLDAAIPEIVTDAAETKTFGGFEYVETYGRIAITAYVGDSKSVSVPNTIEGKKVTSIYSGAFAGNETIESITIPANIDYIQEGTFVGCTSLREFISHNSKYVFSNGFLYYLHPDTDTHQVSSVYNSNISSKTDKNSSSYNEKIEGAVTEYQVEFDVRKSVLWYTKDSVYVTVPEGVDDIAPYAFAKHEKMTHIVLPAGIKRIGKKAFMGCSELVGMSMTAADGNISEFNIPYGTLVIEDSAFIGCTAIRNVNFPITLEAIGRYAFASGMNLKSVYIPQSVKIIGDYAFGSTAEENGSCFVHCETIVLVSDSETDENGNPCAALAYAVTNRENFSETDSYNGYETDEDGNTIVTVQNTFGTETHTIYEPPVTHNPDNDFDHTYVYTACVPVTCTTPGAIAGICVCGHTCYQEFPAPGHAFTEKVTVEPTCTEDGYTGMKCIRCEEVYQLGSGLIVPGVNKPDDKVIIPALGHSYGEPTYTWNEDCSVCSAVSVCEHDDSHTIEEEGKISSRKEGKSIIYTAKFSKLVFSAQSVKVTGETVEALPAPAIGDANGDGDVTLSDAVLLTQLIGEDESMQAQTAQTLDADLDYDGDGAVTLVDLRAILKQLGK